MFSFVYKKIVNPVGLDSSLFWLNSKISSEERVSAANKLGLLCFAALIRINNERIDPQFFINLYKKGEKEAMEQYKNGEISLAEPALKYLAFAFVLLYKHINDHPDAIINFHKIINFLNVHANKDINQKILAILKS